MRVGPALLHGRSGPAAFCNAPKPTHGRGWALHTMPFMSSESPFLKLARERAVLLDGAMGTSLHRYHPTDADWGHGPDGKSLMNLSDALVYTHPEWIEEIHRGFFEAGCD